MQDLFIDQIDAIAAIMRCCAGSVRREYRSETLGKFAGSYRSYGSHRVT